MKILELFAGSRSIGKVAEELGYEVFSSDFLPFEGIDYCVDILNFDVQEVPWTPDIIWASPPCTGFSVAAIGHHWTGGKDAYIPATDTARKGIEMVKKTMEIIQHFSPLVWYIENPAGCLRKMMFMYQDTPLWGVRRHTVTYCQYGDTRMKPTDIWTNNFEWKPRPACKNGDSCHEPAPRGSKTGTQGLKNAYERAIIPYELCKDVLMQLPLAVAHEL